MSDSHEPRLPGQYLDDQIRDKFEAHWFYFGGAATACVLLAIAVWVQWLTTRWLTPWVVTAVAVIGIVYMTWWVRKIRPELHKWRLGLQGERTVGAVLQDLGRMGYVAKHDVPCKNKETGATWNIDHLLIGPSGVYVLETKHRSKVEGGGTTIQFDGERVRVGDGPWVDDPIRQVRGNVEWVRRRLAETGMRDVPIRGVVCYPGRWVDRVGNAEDADVRVVNPKQLFGKLAKLADVLDERRVREVVTVIGN